MSDMTSTSAALREDLTQQLITEGAVKSREWIAALNAVPREVFIPAYFRQDNTLMTTTWHPEHPNEDLPWLKTIYSNETLVTQLDGHRWPERETEATPGNATSSSTLPGLVVWMLEELDVREGMRVLEIGTGTGYSTSLLCQRLGAKNITSIEYDPEVSRRATTAIHSLSYDPTLLTGDGLQGHSNGGPYDRIIATCSTRVIPPAWLQQTKPGAIILTTLAGSLHGYGLAKLVVNDDGTAEGHFLPGQTSFMLARQHDRELDPHVDLLPSAPNKPTQLGPVIFENWTGRFVAQIAAPDVIHTPILMDDDTKISYLADETSNAVAIVSPGESGWQVRQAGSRRIWDEIETGILAWQQAGSPPQDQFRIRTDGETQTIWVEGTDLRIDHRVTI